MGINLGRYCIEGSLFLAPMAGVTDAPFRRLCREFGADYAVGEMVTSAPQLRNSRKTLARVKFFDAEEPRAVQLLGADPAALKDAFYWACEAGAQVVDFNMGCPAKKVCNVACGSALMKEESLALEILSALGEVSKECEVPVTLKCRTGWDEAHKNALTFARAAQKAGFCMVTVHGRTRAGGFDSVFHCGRGWGCYGCAVGAGKPDLYLHERLVSLCKAVRVPGGLYRLYDDQIWMGHWKVTLV